ncbi:MAG: RtcB family protein [Alphaproteobacteria bacterium]|nr:RtcB family protein [Alphaproteobacteria bacterium]MCB9796914.1 RtcB family protein [Alphaproteobacteria bacterium]
MLPLPDNTHLMSGPGVRMEADALDQLQRVAGFEGCVRAVGLPDLHPGPGIPIGASFAFRDSVWPGLVGGDAGCGARLVVARKTRVRGDALLRRVDELSRGAALPDADPGALLEATWTLGPRGLAELPGVPDALATLAALEPEDALPPSGALPDAPELGASLGSIGGGNHFAEITRVVEVSDKETAGDLGLRRDAVAVLVHSGSRGLGALLGRRWGHDPLREEAAQRYLGELAGAVRFAQANRLVLAWRLLEALGAARPGRIASSFDVVHNSVSRRPLEGAPAWVHRKGSAPSEAGQLTVVLGSRGTPSEVMLGRGQEETLASVAHGAGRCMGRSEAVAKLKPAFRRKELQRTRAGGHVLCDDPELLYAEHPKAYKPISPIIDCIEASGAASRVASLLPLITVKR